LGQLRGPIRWRRVKVTLEGKKRKVAVTTRSEKQRRQAQVDRPATAGRRWTGPPPVRYQELPSWARGLLMPGDPGTATLPLSGPFVSQGKQAGHRPRAVPFAFRRRR
ncbi:MAG: hypothetical protein ACRD37_10310, partial [Candidatus Acidiferrales bacterium]